jgi:hypothetical protein
MKTKIQNLLSILAVSGGLVASQSVMANQTPDFAKTLAGTSVVEMPAKAASLVGKSSADKQNAVAVVKAAIGLTPSATPGIVSAIARENPTVAPAISVAAATLQHKQLDLIAKAAVAAAPAQAAKIVAALIKEFPKDYSVIAISAAEADPSAGREILAVVAEYVPSLQASIQIAIAGIDPSGVVSVSAVLSASPVADATPAPQSISGPAAPSLSLPTIGAPYANVPVTVVTVTPTQTKGEAPGSRPVTYPSP